MLDEQASHIRIKLKNGRAVVASKPERPKRDAEIESIKRTLYNAIDKLDRIQRQDAELTAT